MDRLISAARNLFSTPVRDTDVPMSELGNSQCTAGARKAPEPRANFSLGKWLSTISLRFRSPQPSKSSTPRASTPRAAVKLKTQVTSFAELQLQAQAQRNTKVQAGTKPSLRPSVNLVATARLEKTLNHLYTAATSPAYARQELPKAVKAFKSFKELVDKAPNGEQILEQALTKIFGDAQSMKNARLLLLLEPGRVFHQQLETGELRNFLGHMAAKASEKFDAAPSFRY